MQLWDNVCYVTLKTTEPIPERLHASFGKGGFENVPAKIWTHFFGVGAVAQEFYIVASDRGLYYEHKADGGHLIPVFLHAGDATKLIETHLRNNGAALGGQDPNDLYVLPLSPRAEKESAEPFSWLRGML